MLIRDFHPQSHASQSPPSRSIARYVLRTQISTIAEILKARGDEVTFITPGLFKTVPCPTYPEIRLSLVGQRKIGRLIESNRPCAIHIATEGPLGLVARAYCRKRDIPFTTAFHTRFPEYIQARLGVPLGMTYPLIRWFHSPSRAVMVPTRTVASDLTDRGFANVQVWTRGVDLDLFHPRRADDAGANPIGSLGLTGPILLSVGRVSVEKNLAAFLDLDVPGTKVIVGDGPAMASMKKTYPDVVFLGEKKGEELAACYAAADVFVFPSRTDTFGLVLLEALASGVPVAAYPVMGPIDVITDQRAGVLSEDLGHAVTQALTLKREDCRAFAETQSWQQSAEQFRNYLHPFAPYSPDDAGL